MSSRPDSRRSNNDGIDKLDYRPGGRPLVHSENQSRDSSSQPTSYAGSFFEHVAEGVADKDRKNLRREVIRYGSFTWALINCLCAGSITAYSLYAPLFQRRLHYTQLQVNGVSITAELAMYLPVPIWGYLCDRFGPGPPSILSGCSFGLGYLLAAFVYKSGPPPSAGGTGWPYAVMILAFIGIGNGTSMMYLSAVTTCAKNFGRGKYKGIALALPIASFGLSGMWQSQVGDKFLHETNPDGSKGDVDVHRYFLFLGILLLTVGVIGSVVLRIVDESDMIDEAVENMEQSGMLEESEFFRPPTNSNGYGTIYNIEDSDDGNQLDLSSSQILTLQKQAEERRARLREEQRKKTWLLNAETRHFLSDRTMWLLALGFFLVTGPGEAFINNLGTVIGTLSAPTASPGTTAATHVSIVAITSTIARILTGTLTDVLAPSAPAHQHHRGPQSLANSVSSLQNQSTSGRLEVSRVTFLIAFSIICSIGQLLLASGTIQGHGTLFWLVSATVGAGYGAAFSLTPIIISVVWGVENFGTNWGIVATAPAAGATVFGLLYSGVYQWAASRQQETSDGNGLGDGAGSAAEDLLCYGKLCYAPTFWVMTVSVWIACGLWLWAWRGPDGWRRRGVAV
ncbi:MFS general substrate transporter [Polychaeton citri CBS 116435]|uniref:Probable transporter MCH1 n=1 Tax=Polychaeton citri CBS 116435 TaxID=1314669 RepID=A0A9P4Q367_9PEZI|nr:MFS general substrate transporter [Polychaeton citri CBS 116435]